MSTSAPTNFVDETGGHSRYDEYEDSGVDWLGEIPAHWSVRRLKWTVTDCKNGCWGNSPEGGESDINTVRVADFDRFALRVPDQDFTVRSVPTEKREGRVLESGDLLLEKSGGGDKQPVGVVVLYDLDQPAVCSNFVARMPVADGHDPSYLRYLHGALYEAGLNERAIKQSIGIQNLDADFYLNQKVGLPSLDEQCAIAAYLDRETERIDALIEKKEQLIDLLEEKRAALISRVVTQGLDRDVEMQDSGVEWLGEIPVGWEMTKLKFLAGEIIDAEHKTPPFHSDGDYVVVRTSNIRNGKLKYDDAKYTNRDSFEEWTQRGVPQPGDILFTREAPAGEACVVPDGVDLCLGQRVVLIRPNTEVLNNRFCMYSLYSRVTDEYVSVRSQGSTVDHFNMSDIYNIPIPHPSLDEQRDIIKYIDDRRAKIDGLIKVVERAVERLKEYRTALISAAVTGQIDLREEPRTPEVKDAGTWERMILTVELIRRMRSAQHQSLGRTLLVKMLYLIQHHVRVVGMGFNYKRKDYGPYASELRYEVEKALQNQGWIQVSEDGERVHYELLEQADDETIQAYFESSWGDVEDQIDEIVSYFQQFDAERAEIVATLYAAWNDLKILGQTHDEEAILREVRENWHPRKQEIDESRWRKALHWMKNEGLVPAGFGEPTIEEER